MVVPRFMTIWLPRWPVQRRILEQPHWRSVPLLVCRQQRRGVMTVVSWCLPPVRPSLAPRTTRSGMKSGAVNGCVAGNSLSLAGRPLSLAGRPLAEAMDVLARSHGVQVCRSAVIDPDDPLADREALTVLARWCRRFAPLVSVEEPRVSVEEPRVSVEEPRGSASGPECIQLDVSGTAGFFGGENRLARLAVWILAGRGIHARVAIADTPAASWAAAHHTATLTTLLHERMPADRLPAKHGIAGANHGVAGAKHGVAGAKHGVAGASRAVGRAAWAAGRYVVVPPGETVTLLSPLSPTALRLAEDDLLRLAELGIDTIGGVLRLPRAELAARFSPLLHRRLAQFRGTIAEPLTPPAADELPQARHAWEAPVLVRDLPREALERLMQQLIAGCVAPLAAAGRGVTALQVRFERPRWCHGQRDGVGRDGQRHGGNGRSADGDEGPTVIDVGLYRPSASVGHLADLVRLRMARTPLPREIDGIAVEVLADGQVVTRQRLLFDAGVEADSQVGMLLDRLSGRLGRRSVFTPRAVADAQPEHAWMPAPPVPAGGAPSRHRSRETQQRPGGMHGQVPAAPQRRPVWLLPRPRRLEVVSVVPDGPPVRFRRQSQWLRVAQAQGAERIETAWWRGPCVRRDYWIVEVESGERYWIFRRLPDGAWFIHGLFG
jgi:protein ImuB